MMPPGEMRKTFARSGTKPALHLAIHRLEEIVVTLTPFYGPDCPVVAIVARASHPSSPPVFATLMHPH